jgi:hypothetical protein
MLKQPTQYGSCDFGFHDIWSLLIYCMLLKHNLPAVISLGLIVVKK